jgi:flagellar protein FliO/FliZ
VPYEPDGFASISLALVVIAALLWAALWALRRARPNGAVWGPRDCTIIRSLALGPRERLLVVRVGSKHLVVGVGAAAISLLCELDEPLAPIASADAKFGQAVRNAIKRWHGE